MCLDNKGASFTVSLCSCFSLLGFCSPGNRKGQAPPVAAILKQVLPNSLQSLTGEPVTALFRVTPVRLRSPAHLPEMCTPPQVPMPHPGHK